MAEIKISINKEEAEIVFMANGKSYAETWVLNETNGFWGTVCASIESQLRDDGITLRENDCLYEALSVHWFNFINACQEWSN